MLFGRTSRVLWVLLLLLPACSGPADRGGPANVLLITLDTTRADHIGAYGNTSIETPALDRLAEEGIRFDRAVTSVPWCACSTATSPNAGSAGCGIAGG